MHGTKVEFSPPLNGELDPFLTESVGIEENGMALTVLSALARLGLDPWAEARYLASLPKQAAILAIARRFALKDDSAIAARLAVLLPEQDLTARAQGLSRTERVHSAIRRNVWLWLALWLAACVLFVLITGFGRR
ncbi:MAG TPA: hypothetical protein VKZ79_16865 [Alphaproteobacteria bacterium]|nr:hypothetical protein [Alphaproteobacteria bacterium]